MALAVPTSPLDSNNGLEDLKVLLECPVCMEMSVPPIFNCKVGHIICRNCQPKVKKCPVCRGEYNGCRNFVAEKLAEKYLCKCKYVLHGCPISLKTNEVDLHIKTCEYRPVKCVIGACGNDVPFMKYFEHLRESHKIFAAAENVSCWQREMFVFNIKRLVKDGPRIPFAMTCYGHKFLQCMHAEDNKIWIWVAYCGFQKGMEDFQATIVIANEQKKLEMQWSGPIHSARKTGTEVYNSGLCLLTTGPALQHFMSSAKGNKFIWTMKIKIISNEEIRQESEEEDEDDEDEDEDEDDDDEYWQ